MSVVSQQDLVKKIYFPREILPISFVTSCFVNMLLSFVVVFIVIAVSGLGFNAKALLYLPVIRDFLFKSHDAYCAGVS